MNIILHRDIIISQIHFINPRLHHNHFVALESLEMLITGQIDNLWCIPISPNYC